ncbi:Rne/Rng family ribonuclease [Bacillus suaedaesalsae]|uniref:Rne/Rng family ribonuclease n=1 Tax=Bacillus suaedaesalsae TaxID=2810349 RepID=A0ABS2DNN3_9BACI|nr:Rne/Rng family ribonuclease [Bacillus suaedaesalsae]MBM6619740.1 Rne/Rng family ribonuclease [Bacillus suaedaesalsae]
MNLLTTEKRIAVLEDAKAAEFYFSHPASEDLTGNIYIGRVTKVLPGMQAAFVDIGLEKNGFLHRDQLITYHTNTLETKREKNISEFVREGESLLVQVEKNSVGTKGPKLTNVIEVGGHSIIYVPNGNYVAISKKMKNEETRSFWRNLFNDMLRSPEGVVARTSTENCSVEEIQKELDKLRNVYNEIQEKQKHTKAPALLHASDHLSERYLKSIGTETIHEVIVDTSHDFQRIKHAYPNLSVQYYDGKENIFTHYSLETEVDRLSKKIVWLSNGSYLIIEHTEAMTVIDVNTGKFTGKTNLKDTVFKTNEQAVVEIARQLRLRDIGGMILIDLIDMKSAEDKAKLIRVFSEHLKKDRTRTVVYGFTQLGILEMTRKRVRENIVHQQTEQCITCGNGYVQSKNSLMYKLERELMELRGNDAEVIWIEATFHLVELMNETQMFDLLENALRVKLYVSEMKDVKPNYYIRHIGSLKEIEERMNSG